MLPRLGADVFGGPLRRGILRVPVRPLVHGGRPVHRLEGGEGVFMSKIRNQTLHDPVRVAEASCVVGPLGIVVGNATKHGFDQPACSPRQLDRGRDDRVCRCAQEVQLVSAHPQHCPSANVELSVDVPIRQPVARPPHAHGSVHDLGYEAPVTLGQL